MMNAFHSEYMRKRTIVDKHHGSTARTTRKPMMKSMMKGCAASNERLAERQSKSEASHAPPRITLKPIAFDGAPWGSVTEPPGYGPYQSWHHSQTFPAMS